MKTYPTSVTGSQWTHWDLCHSCVQWYIRYLGEPVSECPRCAAEKYHNLWRRDR